MVKRNTIYSAPGKPLGGECCDGSISIVTTVSDRWNRSKRFLSVSVNHPLLKAGVDRVRSSDPHSRDPLGSCSGIRAIGTRVARCKKNRTQPRPSLRTSISTARACGHGFSPNARENSKYPKSTPFVPIFSYLNPSTFHTISNVGLNDYSFF